jgi:transcriptional regulator GlxA family with amidase domain
MYFLRQIRLEHVHDELLSPETTTTVSEAAMRWGFSHFGRFAADYAKLYGEAPSATRGRNRARRKQPT